jgi:hypothetical protein
LEFDKGLDTLLTSRQRQAPLTCGVSYQLLHAVDLHEGLIDVEGVAVASLLSFQSSSVEAAEFDAP